MKTLIVIVTLLTFNACAENSNQSKKKYLSESEAMHYYTQGIMLECGPDNPPVVVTNQFTAMRIGEHIVFQPAVISKNEDVPTAFAEYCVLH